MAHISVKIEGAERFQRILSDLKGNAPKALAKALYQEAEAIMAKSKLLVPVDTGNLRASGHVELPRIEGSSISVTLGYGGPAAKYAWYVHENLSARHTTGQAKYLEQPALEAQSGMSDRIAERLRKELNL